MPKQITFWESAPLTPLQKINDPLIAAFGVELYLKRDDLLHPQVSGNKWRKLKYNFLQAQQLGFNKIITFGGAYSNHIAATAAAGKALGVQTVGIIRGNELHSHSNPTLSLAAANGMELIFVSREEYREKQNLIETYGNGSYPLPEGGSNDLAIKGVAEVVPEIIEQLGFRPTYLATALGTGGTFAGLCGQTNVETRVLGFAVLKNGQYLLDDINHWISQEQPFKNVSYEIFWDFHCGGYGKITPDLQHFMSYFEQETGILLDPTYTAKMLFWLYELIKRGDFFKAGDTIVALHTGGLQGRKRK